jgi:hypothetical protein
MHDVQRKLAVVGALDVHSEWSPGRVSLRRQGAGFAKHNHATVTMNDPAFRCS